MKETFYFENKTSIILFVSSKFKCIWYIAVQINCCNMLTDKTFLILKHGETVFTEKERDKCENNLSRKT